MPSSYTPSLRFELQFTGENVNLWGDKLNAALSRADDAVAGWLTKPLTGDYTLATANGGADEARKAMLKFTGTGSFTVTVPAVSKRYDVWNACTGVLTITNGSVSVVLASGEKASVITDGGGAIGKIQATDFGGVTLTSLGSPANNTDAATKKYVDDSVFGIAAGSLPGQVGNGGKFLTTNGSTAAWGDPLAGPVVTGSVKQNVQAVAALSIDLSASDFFTKAIAVNSTFTFANPTASKAQAFAIKLTITSSAVPTWPGTVLWSSGVAPTLLNGTHVLGFITFDGGTSWIGVLVGFNVA
jgi:hypothetical protein